MATLYVVSTPIGNLEDITLRAIRILLTARIIVCEDTRRTGLLLDELKKRYPQIIPPTITSPKLIRLDDYKEQTIVAEIIEKLENGEDIVLVSDAGTPLVSDPGYILVSQAKKRHIPVIAIPGASAFLSALVSSGLTASAFTFLGYPPEKEGHRIKFFASIIESNKALNATYIFYAAPHKLKETLSNMQTVFGNIDVTLARELTKIHEEVVTLPITSLLALPDDPKGEYVVLFKIV